MAELEPPYYPIIYVRGYAATQGEMDATVATPYMGFNLGATKIRQNHKGDIVSFIFESPLIRLMKDDGYTDAYRDGVVVGENTRMPAKSVWVYRYYEKGPEDPGKGQRQSIEEFAEGLREFILLVRDRICRRDDPAQQQALLDRFRVYLVAHSMGGLICRAYLQSLCRRGVLDANGRPDTIRNNELKLEPMTDQTAPVPASVHLVDKVFTYASPHNGIEIAGVNVPDLGKLDGLDVSNFNRDRMREYLALGDDQPANDLNGAFDANRFFCLIGSDHDDYHAFFKLARRGVGPMSDGLVLIKNAYVDRAPRAFVYRSHSGDYGIVNSEEGYQNLRRFLFGQWRVDAQLYAHAITLPTSVREFKDKGHRIRASYNVESTLRVRGAHYMLHERKESQGSAIRCEYDALVKQGRPAYLFSNFLLEPGKEDRSQQLDRSLAFLLNVAVKRPLYEVERSFWEFWLPDHFEGADLLNENITFHIRLNAKKRPIRYGLSSRAPLGTVNRTPVVETINDGACRLRIPLGFPPDAAKPPPASFSGELVLTARRWNA